jgi:leucyl aminopeptidase
MEIVVVQVGATEHATPLLAIPLLEGESELGGPAAQVDAALGGKIMRVLGEGDFKGKDGQLLALYPDEGELPAKRVVLVGFGKREKLDPERIRRGAATVVKHARRIGVDRVSIFLPPPDARLTTEAAARALAEGAELGAYVFDEYKSREGEETPESKKVVGLEILRNDAEGVSAIEAGVRVGAALGRAENFARTLGNLPGNVATPGYLGSRAREIGERFGMTVTVLGRAELENEGLRALLAVAQGSEEEPRLIVVEHRKGPSGSKPLVLVGKGVTFDSGGISIKPAASMEDMKFDMCGGAAVLGAMHGIGELDLPIDVIGIVPSSENLLSGNSMKPGDIIRSHLGKTIEIVNTDAEGRLLLVDALSYARRFEPAAIVDAATLTGACVIALGVHVSAAFGNDEGLLNEIKQAGERAYERVWPMPLFDEYREQIRSDYADLRNQGSGKGAGTITAALFLREFVENTPWVHLDIAGTAYGDGKIAYQAKGSTGNPTRLLVEWVISRAA